MATEKDISAKGIAYQIPRDTLALLMVGQVVVVLPYLFQLSVWIIAVGLFCGYWRSMVYQGRWDYPGRGIKVLLVVASFAGVLISGVGAFSLETASSLLILAFALKLIEMKSRRDAYLVIFLSYFVIATQFLFDQTILVTLYELGAIVLVTAAMVGLNQLHTQVKPAASIKLAATLVGQAVPLTIVLFLLFPRVAPLWTVPLPSSGATGISDRVSPGDIARLSQSDELAFRVVFSAGVPVPRDLYWRGLVYNHFGEGTWTVDPNEPRRWRLNEPGEGGSAGDGPRMIDYEVLLEPTLRTWLYALDDAYPTVNSVFKTRSHRLEVLDPVMSVFRYQVRSFPDEALDIGTERRRWDRETLLMDEGNPRIRDFARSLAAESGSVDEFVRALLRQVREQSYSYTLSPPLYQGENSIDAFWFDGRAGFCTHYAGAFVYMMRAAGIPARMVGGYQGGEVNPITGHLIVRQYDAHAWTEIWIAGRGWERVDPTGAVAPERIEQGLRAALSVSDRESLSVLTNARMGQWDMLGDFLLWTDSLEHRWNLWVVGYDANFQTRYLQRLLGELTPLRIGLALLVGGALSLGAVSMALFWRRRPVRRHPVERAVREFSDKLAGYGYQREFEESPSAYVRRIADEVGLTEAQVGPLIAELDTLLYNPSVAWGKSELRSLRAQLRRLQFRLAFGSNR